MDPCCFDRNRKAGSLSFSPSWYSAARDFQDMIFGDFERSKGSNVEKLVGSQRMNVEDKIVNEDISRKKV